MTDVATTATRPFPPGSCDTHIHVYDHRFPVAATARMYPLDASADGYRVVQTTLGLERVVVVQPTTYGLDNACLLAALATFGPAARAVAVVDNRVTADELNRLHALGVRGARCYLLPGGAFGWDIVPAVATLVAPLGWHLQIQMNGRDLADRAPLLRSLPAPLVIDHVGRFMPPVTPDDPAFASLLGLVDTGQCWVKLAAPYESAPDPAHRHAEVSALARALVRHAPERLVWGSNWPHPGQTAPPTLADLGCWADEWMPDPAVRRRIMVDNPAALYGFDPLPAP